MLVPAIAIPVKEKTSFECPPAHLLVLKGHLEETDRLLIIGWRGRDRHFVRLLEQHLPKRVSILAVGNGMEDARATLEELASAGIEAASSEASRTNGFTEFTVKRDADAFLTG